MTAVLELKSVRRVFQQGDITVEVLKDINLSIAEGEVVALVGPSGAGKSTLLQVAGLLEQPTAGDVIINGESCRHRDDAERTQLRLSCIGFVYQFHHLLNEFSALENVSFPQRIAGKSAQESQIRAAELLERMGLAHRLNHRPKKLSGGEQQRVAIARALANNPRILLADEPTGNLDSHTSDAVFDEMMTFVRETKLSALIATHNLDLARRMDRCIVLRDGCIEK